MKKACKAYESSSEVVALCPRHCSALRCRMTYKRLCWESVNVERLQLLLISRRLASITISPLRILSRRPQMATVIQQSLITRFTCSKYVATAQLPRKSVLVLTPGRHSVLCIGSFRSRQQGVSTSETVMSRQIVQQTTMSQKHVPLLQFKVNSPRLQRQHKQQLPNWIANKRGQICCSYHMQRQSQLQHQ